MEGWFLFYMSKLRFSYIVSYMRSNAAVTISSAHQQYVLAVGPLSSAAVF